MKIGYKWAIGVVIFGTALSLRMIAVHNLPVDWDEKVYLGTARSYAKFIEAYDWRSIIDYAEVNEHPALGKFLLGMSIVGNSTFRIENLNLLPLEEWYLPKIPLVKARTLNAVFGALTAVVVGIASPLAGIFLAIHTFAVKYTSLIYLEALPGLTSTISAITFVKYNSLLSEANQSVHKHKKRQWIWLGISGIFLGLTAASKYMYCIVGMAIIVYSLIQDVFIDRWGLKRVKQLLVWGLISILVFFLFNFYLWPDPIGRLSESILFHVNYSQGEYVQSFKYPVWQPFIWLSKSIPMHPYRAANSSPGSFLITIDPVISILALIGLIPLIKRNSFYGYWLIVAMIFLMVWPTKWAAYILLAIVPLVVSAAAGVNFIVVEISTHAKDFFGGK